MAKNRVLYLALLLCSIWIFIVYIDYSALAILVLFVTLPIVMLIITFICSRNVTVSVMGDNGMVEKHSTGKITLHVKNTSLMPFSGAIMYITVENCYDGKKYTKKLKINIPDREVSKFIINISSPYCGKIHVSVSRFKIYDCFGIWSFKGKIKNEGDIYVVPHINVVNLVANRNMNEYVEDPVMYSEQIPGDDNSQVFDVREYMQGDKIQRIHWKLTAKKEDMYVKEFSMPIDASAMIFAELSVSDNTDTIKYADAVIETVFLISMAMLNNEQYHYICWYDVEQGCIIKQDIIDENDIWSAMYGLMNVKLYNGDKGIEAFENSSYAGEDTLLMCVTSGSAAKVSYNPCRIICISENGADDSDGIINVQVDNVAESIERIGEI